MIETSPEPTLVGVIDLMGGVAVRAIGGNREFYRPVHSRLAGSSDPRQIASAFRAHYAIHDLYVADLDGIGSSHPNWETIEALVNDGFRVTVDVGLRRIEQLDAAEGIDIAAFVIALETLPGPDTLVAMLDRFGTRRLVFSLDLANGVPLADPAAWGETTWNTESPLRLAQIAASIGVERLIVLDLKAVGMAAGPVTTELCQRITQSLPSLSVWSGGGVRTAADVFALRRAGVQAVLAASALHDGTIPVDWLTRSDDIMQRRP